MLTRRTASAALVSALVFAAAACGDDDAEPSAGSGGECPTELLERASLNTDSFPSIVVEPSPPEDRWGALGEVECVGTSRAANITYLVGEFDAAGELPPDTAVDDGYAVVEPGGQPASRLEDPGDTWSDHPGASELVRQLSGDGAVRFQLVAPNPDRGPVRLMSSAVDADGRSWLVVQFADEASVADGVDAVVSELPSSITVDGEPEIDGTEVTIELSADAQAPGLIAIDPDLALATRR